MKLTRQERDQIRAGGAPRLTFPGDEPCPLEPGDELAVASNLSIVIDRIRKTKKDEHHAVYTIRDFRVRLPRRVPPVHTESKGHLDEYGMPAPPSAAQIKLASIEGATTSAKRLAVQGHELAENVEAEDYRVIKMQSKARHAKFEEAEHAERVAEQQAKQLTRKLRKLQAEAVRVGVDITPRLVGMVREAEAELAEKRHAA